jgi:hypothetical protein
MAVPGVQNEIFDADLKNLTDNVASVRTKSIQALTVCTERTHTP